MSTDIIRMAREVGFILQRDEYMFQEMLEAFAALVAAAEREACAKECEAVDCGESYYAAAIRARRRS